MKTLQKIFLYLTILLALLPEKTFSIDDNNDYVIKQLKVKDGLSQSSILALLQDRRGFMWFGTGSGLNRFDGYTFKVYLNNPLDTLSISDNGVSALYEDSDGYIWVGTTGGYINCFDRRTDTFKRFKLELMSQSIESVQDNYYEYPLLYSRSSDESITTISEDKYGNIWIGTWGRGIYLLNKDDGSVQNFCNIKMDPNSLSFDRVTKIISDDQDNIWIATFGGGLNKAIFSSNSKNSGQSISFLHYQSNSTNKLSLSDNKITALFFDKNGSLWIGTYSGSLIKLENLSKDNSFETSKFITIKSLANYRANQNTNSIMAVTEDDSGFLWIGTFGDGLYRLNVQSNSLISFMHNNLDENTIADNDIISLCKDRSGIIWVGTHLGEGISRLERKNIKFDIVKPNPTAASSLNDDVVWSILKDKEEILWIGTYRGGLNRYDEKRKIFTSYKNISGNSHSISNNHVRAIVEDKSGNLWIGTYAGGLNKFDRHTGVFYSFIHSSFDSTSVGGNQVQKIFIDSNSIMWIAVFGGGLNVMSLNEHPSSTPHFIKYKFDPNDSTSISDNRVYTIYKDRQNNLWVGTFGGGLNRFDRNNKNFERFRNDPTNPFSLQNDKVLCLYEDRSGSFWIGTSGSGLIKFDRDRKKFISYNSQADIQADVIYGILEDEQKNLWLSTSNGIYRFSYETGSTRHYDLQDGVQSLEFSGGAYFKAGNGEMFFGGINGLNRFFPNLVRDNSFIPPVVITAIKVANHFVKGEVEKLILMYHENFISFEFAALAYSDPYDNSYSYMLEGFDENWTSTDAKYRIASYTNLPPGEYIFKVKGANQDGIWNPNEVKIFITITPPFWRTWWFIALSVTLISAGIYYMGTMRVRNELAIEKLKTKLAADLHDNIGSGLTEISILSELADKDASLNSNFNVQSKLKNISEVARQLIDNMSDIVWFVNPKRDSLRDLLVRLKDSYSDLLHSLGISFKIINLDKLNELRLPMDYRQNLYLIFKEGINNAIKHSNCKKIILGVNVRNNIIELTLCDDGIGLEVENLKYGNGIRNMESRSKLLGGKLKLNSVMGKGTTIIFIGKIKSPSIFNRNFQSN